MTEKLVDSIILGPMSLGELKKAHASLSAVLQLPPQDGTSRADALAAAARNLRGSERPGRTALTIGEGVRRAWVRDVWFAEKLTADQQNETIARLTDEIEIELALTGAPGSAKA